MNQKATRLWQAISTPLAAAFFFVAVCLCSGTVIRRTSVLLVMLTLSAAFLFYSRLRDRVGVPLLALGLVVIAGGLSNLYAVSGKFALFEFLKLLCAFCLTLLLLAFTGERKPDRRIASILAGCTAIAGVVSIDLLSTRWISTPVLAFLNGLGCGIDGSDWVEEGVRMIGIFVTPNVFAGCAGIGVLLSLGLAATARGKVERPAQLACLFVNALSFVLVFSMGASGSIAAAFVAYLLLARREDRIDRLLLMVETLALTLLAAFPISQTSFSAWTGVQPAPLLCLIAGATLLCVLDAFVGRRVAALLRGQEKAVLAVMLGTLAALALFIAAAFRLTGGASLEAGETLRRAAYPEPGAYTVEAGSEGELSIYIESQNRAETQMHTSTELYNGPLDGAAFTVPEGSEVVYFTFTAGTDARLERAGYQGANGSGSIPLRYRLLPGFIANRLQGLRANENAIQRLAFFEDAMKLFWRSPLIGQGLGAFSNGRYSVQSFNYGTLYVHNHYIQTLDETGIIGLALFVGMFVIAALAVWRSRRQNELAPALGAALVFMAGHAAVEVVFSIYCYLPIAFGVFGLISLSCGSAIPSPLDRQKVRAGLLLGCSGLIGVFMVLLGGNIAALQIANGEGGLSKYEEAAMLDRFEWADHLLAYVMGSLEPGADEEVRQKADGYALRLAKLDSNIIPMCLTEYYLRTGRPEQALEMAKQYVNYLSAYDTAWQIAFDLLEQYAWDTPEYRAGVLEIAGMLDDWNAEHLGDLTLTEKNLAFIASMSD